MFPLYIDPGTGSAIFSIVIGATAALYFVVRAFFIKIKTLVLGGRTAKLSRNYHPYVIYNEGSQYINVFLPVIEEFENRRVELLYLTSAEDDPAFTAGYSYIKPEYIGEGNKAFARLNFLSAGIVLATTPGLDVYQWKRSKAVKHYSHLIHATGDPAIYEMFALDYYDSVLLTGDWQSKDIRFLEKLRELPEKTVVTVGCSYLDVAAEQVKGIDQKTDTLFTVLVSPSWGASSLLVRYGERLLGPLVNTKFHIIVRPHPQSKKTNADVLERLSKKYENVENIEWDYERENVYAMARSDIMISDFSGIIFDYTFLFNKPVIYANYGMDLRAYDAYFLDYEMWRFEALRRFGVELREEDFKNIGELLKKASDDPLLKEGRKFVKEQMWQNRGEAGKLTVDFMIDYKQLKD